MLPVGKLFHLDHGENQVYIIDDASPHWLTLGKWKKCLTFLMQSKNESFSGIDYSTGWNVMHSCLKEA